jgi:transcriptional regulator
MIGALVGIEIPISRIHGKWKVSQNRPFADRLGVAAGLQSQDNDQSRAMAELVMQRSGRSISK